MQYRHRITRETRYSHSLSETYKHQYYKIIFIAIIYFLDCSGFSKLRIARDVLSKYSHRCKDEYRFVKRVN